MMLRRYRLRRSGDFARLRKGGQTIRHAYFIVSYMPNDCPHNRYGLIISKHIGKAVTRNRIRRVLREIIRAMHPSLSQGYDIVFVVRRAIIGKPYRDIQRIVSKSLRQAGIMLEDNIQ